MPSPSREHGHLPRLARPAYRGLAAVHWVFTVQDRRTGWLDESFFVRFQLVATHAFHRYRLVGPCLCLMPDHIHLLVLGVDEERSDQLAAMSFLRRQLRPHLAPCDWQRPAYDHVLRDHERQPDAFVKTASYIRANPFRAGLVPDEASPWPFACAVVPGYPDLDPAADDFWERFWRIYDRLVNPRPPIREEI